MRIHRYHRTANLGTQMNRIIEQSGVPIWEKTFQNLRATRRTELQENFQDHVVNAWMGHSSPTAAKHYLQVTDEHFASGLATETGERMSTADSGGPIPADMGHYEGNPETKKPRKTLGIAGSMSVHIASSATPLGLSQSPDSQGIPHASALVVPPVVPSVQETDIRTEELSRLWSALDEAGRADLLAVAQGLAARQSPSAKGDSV